MKSHRTASNHLSLPNVRTRSSPQQRRAAEGGQAASQHNLGVAYSVGNGVEEDHAQAVFWFLKAAEQGYVILAIFPYIYAYALGFCLLVFGCGYKLFASKTRDLFVLLVLE